MKVNKINGLLNNYSQQSSDWTWLCFSLSILLLPLFPILGTLGLLIIIIKSGQDNLPKIIANRHNQALAILSILFIVSSALAEQPKEAWLGLANFLPFFLLFAALKPLIRHPIQLKQLSWLLILPSLPIIVLGFGQLFAGWHTPPLVKFILGWKLVAQGVPTGRMSAVFNYTNFLAIYLAIAFSLALGLWLDTWQAWRKNPANKQLQILSLLTVILLADISGLVLTSSRNAWGLAAISFMAYAAYMGWRWLIYGVSSAATAILWASFAPNLGGTQLRKVVPSFFWARLSDRDYQRPVETLRITLWEFCWDLIKQRPLFGWGLRNFTPLYEAKTNFWFGHPHNLFLMLGAETGIIAVLLIVCIVGSIMAGGVKLLLDWSTDDFRLIFFSYLVSFTCCILFNLFDVTIFDLRVNVIGWVLLSAISGVITAEQSAKA